MYVLSPLERGFDDIRKAKSLLGVFKGEIVSQTLATRKYLKFD